MPYPNKTRTKDKYPWIGQVRVNGVRTRKLFTNKRTAKQWEEEEKGRLLAGPQVQTRSISLIEWATKYLEFSQQKFVKETFEEKRFAFKLLFQDVDPGTLVEEFKPIMALNHLSEQDKNRSGNGANKSRKNLRAAWQWGIRYLDMPNANPFGMVFKFAEDRHERRVPTLEEFWAVFNATNDQQDKLMLLMYLQTGARRDELFRLTWRDVDFAGKRVRLFWRKNAAGQWESAWLPIKDELVAMLRDHQKVTGLLRLVFLNMWENKDRQKWVPFEYRNKWLPTLCRRAKVEPFGLHGVRHLTASLLAAAGLPLVEIQHMLRHKSISTTQRYIHSLSKENRGVLEALPGTEPGSKSPSKAHPEAAAI